VVGYDITTLDKDLFTANEAGNHKNNLNILYTLPFPYPSNGPNEMNTCRFSKLVSQFTYSLRKTNSCALNLLKLLNNFFPPRKQKILKL